MTNSTLSEIHRLAVSCGLADPGTRSLLIPDAALRAQIPVGRNASEQLLHDLTALRCYADPETGQCALTSWLERASALLAPRPESRTFAAWSQREWAVKSQVETPWATASRRRGVLAAAALFAALSWGVVQWRPWASDASPLSDVHSRSDAGGQTAAHDVSGGGGTEGEDTHIKPIDDEADHSEEAPQCARAYPLGKVDPRAVVSANPWTRVASADGPGVPCGLQRVHDVLDMLESITDDSGVRSPNGLVVAERFGMLLAALELALEEGAYDLDVEHARARVSSHLKAVFPFPLGLSAMAIRGEMIALPMCDPDDSACTPDVSLGAREVSWAQVQHMLPGAPVMFSATAVDDTPTQPARWVSWYFAVAFANWVDARLPTDDEWVVAVRNSPDWSSRDYCAGIPLTTVAHFRASSPQPVGSLDACHGFYDLHGNVAEWTSTPDYPGAAHWPAGAATTRRSPHLRRVMRGGAFTSKRRSYLGIGHRYAGAPHMSMHNIGFRLAFDGSPPGA